jgi:hypothetical protein
MSTHARNNTTHKFKLPEMVNPDMDNGLETVSCELAQKFYEHHSKELHRMKNREDVRRFYVSTVGKWAASTDGPGARHFNQVLYALCREGKVCRVTNNGKEILWKANIPRRSLISRSERLSDENRKLKAEIKELKSRVTPLTIPLSPPDSPRFVVPSLKRQSACCYDEDEFSSSPLHLAKGGMEEGENLVDVEI